MRDTDTPITLDTAAMLLVAKLTAYGWRFSVKRDGELHVVFGDDPPGLNQHTAMEVIGGLMREVKTLLWPGDDAATVH